MDGLLVLPLDAQTVLGGDDGLDVPCFGQMCIRDSTGAFIATQTRTFRKVQNGEDLFAMKIFTAPQHTPVSYTHLVNASFNYERQMSQGAQYALSPILQKLYPDKKELEMCIRDRSGASVQEACTADRPQDARAAP